ncbi:MAG: riboflavin biosynthesis protein RibF [Dehalococcoidia bacterium]
MSIADPFNAIRAQQGPTVATVGTFDGVHLGHRKLVETVLDEAQAVGGSSLAMIFEGQPRAFINPTVTVSYLSSAEDRVSWLSNVGIDNAVVLQFDESIQKLSSGEFVSELKRRVGLSTLVLGPGAMIGSDRANASTLQSTLEDVKVISVEAESLHGDQISSSRIRQAIEIGDCETATGMLGRNYGFTGLVGEGDKRGQELGFPTANIEPDFEATVPANGIYATRVTVDGETHRAATSIGVRPTFETDGRRTIEAYLLDFDGDLYTKRLHIEFVSRLRGEVAFESVDALIEQMNSDVEQTREIIKIG